ncbi:MAG: MarR family transcriptional regulator [Deltaproteobacteria bacterium]|nr:MarR family transcriptional regulator [Deltaproteobacteria bacterium]
MVKIDWKLTEGYRLLALLGETFHALFDARKSELHPSGVSMKRARALWGIGAMGRPATVAEMSPFLGRDRHTTAQMLRRMEKEGLLERHQGLYRNNAVAWTLTEKGEEDLRRSLERHEIIDEIVSVLSEDEQSSLSGCLKKLRDAARAKAAVSIRLPEPIAKKLGV